MVKVFNYAGVVFGQRFFLLDFLYSWVSPALEVGEEYYVLFNRLWVVVGIFVFAVELVSSSALFGICVPLLSLRLLKMEVVVLNLN